MGVSRVGRFSTDLETSFGQNQVETWRDQRIVEPPEIEVTKSRLEDTTVQDRLHDFPGFKDGIRRATIKAPQYAEGLPAALDQATPYSAPQTGLEEILTALMGGVIGNSGSDISGVASTTTAINVTNGEGARFSKGGALVVRHSSAQSYEMREIKNVDTSGDPDVLTLKHALAAAPTTAGTDVYNCVTYFLDQDAVGGSGNSLAVRYLGLHADDQWIARGVGGTFGIQFKLDDYVKFTWDLQAAEWEGPTLGETLAGASIAGGGGLVWKDAQLQWQTVGTTTRNVLHVESIEINPGLAIVAEDGVTPAVGGPGVNGRLRYRMVRARPTVKFSAWLYENFTEFYTQFATETTARMVMLTIGTSPIISGAGTGMMGFSLPRCYYTKAPKINRGNADGLIMVEVEMQGAEDTDITSPSSGESATADLHQSAFRIHQA